MFRGYLGAGRSEKYLKPCKIKIGKKLWAIFKGKVKIHSGAAQLLGFR